MAAAPTIPVIDIAPFLSGGSMERRSAARTFGRTFEHIGFACIVGHGIPEKTVLRTYEAARHFFDLPEEEKLLSAITNRVKDRGYVPMGVESVAITRNQIQPPDLCEALVFNAMDKEPGVPQPGSISDVTGNIYPRSPKDLAEALYDYFLRIDRFANILMQIAALALDLQEDFFAPYVNRRRGRLRVINYPDQGKDPLPGQLRYGAHSDYGSFTILRQDAAPGGLQVQMPNGSWEDVQPMPEAFVINIGDLMARWTNDRWKSTLHRVANPPREAVGTTRRISMAYFVGVNADAMIECLASCRSVGQEAKYAPVRAAEYIASKLDRSMLVQ